MDDSGVRKAGSGTAAPSRVALGRPGSPYSGGGQRARPVAPSGAGDGHGTAVGVHESGRGPAASAHPPPLGPLTATAIGREAAPGTVTGWCETPAQASLARGEGAVKGEATPATGPRFRLRVLRERCKDCIGGPQRATGCEARDCALWDYRTGHRPRGGKARRTPLQALRAHCVWCCDGQYREVRLCPAVRCSLWPWRMGRATGERRPAGVETGGAQGE